MGESTKIEPVERELLDELLESLPDKPRWVMARSLLLSGRCDVILGPEGRRQAGFFVVDAARPFACQAVFRPVGGLVETLFERHPETSLILAHSESAEHLGSLLPGWIARPVTAHIAPNDQDLPASDLDVRFLTRGDEGSLAHLPPRLREEIVAAIDTSPTCAVFVDGRPVGFCYAPYETETWWDVAVDTVAGYRRKGYASAAAAYLVDYMRLRGKRAVWGALDANTASLKMAEKYGFRVIDRLIAFTPGDRRGEPRV